MVALEFSLALFFFISFFCLHELTCWTQLVVQLPRQALSRLWSGGNASRLAHCSSVDVSAPSSMPWPCSCPAAPTLLRTPWSHGPGGEQGHRAPALCTVQLDWFSKEMYSCFCTHLYLKPRGFLKGRLGFIS